MHVSLYIKYFMNYAVLKPLKWHIPFFNVNLSYLILKLI